MRSAHGPRAGRGGAGPRRQADGPRRCLTLSPRNSAGRPIEIQLIRPRPAVRANMVAHFLREAAVLASLRSRRLGVSCRGLAASEPKVAASVVRRGLAGPIPGRDTPESLSGASLPLPESETLRRRASPRRPAWPAARTRRPGFPLYAPRRRGLRAWTGVSRASVGERRTARSESADHRRGRTTRAYLHSTHQERRISHPFT